MDTPPALLVKGKQTAAAQGTSGTSRSSSMKESEDAATAGDSQSAGEVKPRSLAESKFNGINVPRMPECGRICSLTVRAHSAADTGSDQGEQETAAQQSLKVTAATQRGRAEGTADAAPKIEMSSSAPKRTTQAKQRERNPCEPCDSESEEDESDDDDDGDAEVGSEVAYHGEWAT